jgi:hypothetical protein
MNANPAPPLVRQPAVQGALTDKISTAVGRPGFLRAIGACSGAGHRPRSVIITCTVGLDITRRG